MIDLAFECVDELKIRRERARAELIVAQELPEFPPVGFKLNHARIRDLDNLVYHLSQVIEARETVSL